LSTGSLEKWQRNRWDNSSTSITIITCGSSMY